MTAETKSSGRPAHTKILFGLLVGAVAGVGANMLAGPESVVVSWMIQYITDPIGAIFMRLLLMIVVPLVFASLVVGVAGIGDIRTLGRVGAKSFGYTLVISAISVLIGVTLANTIQPGKRLQPDVARALEERYAVDAEKRVSDIVKPGAADSPLLQTVKTIIPTNPFAAMASDPPNMLHIMFFALVIGVAIALAPTPLTEPVVKFAESVFDIASKIIDLVMKFAPYAVACLLFNNTARFGLDLLAALGWFVITVLLGLSIHMFGVYSLSIKFLSKLSPIDFFRRVKTVIFTAFSTSSSNATLPTTLRVSEENLGVPRQINSFVLTVGATANQNGTALYEGVTILFLAQLAGVDLSLGQQITVAYLAILGGIGTAGVPSGSIPFIILALTQFGINPALIAIILGVDRILDMCRTTLNVVGDITAATYVAKSEGYTLTPARDTELR